ncbi:hypothetical protein SMICM304S_04918 [Streptomyces microflavus]
MCRGCCCWRRHGRPRAWPPDCGFVPAEGRTHFHRYAEFGSPCSIGAEVLPCAVPGEARVRVTGHQDGEPVFDTVLSGPLSTVVPGRGPGERCIAGAWQADDGV